MSRAVAVTVLVWVASMGCAESTATPGAAASDTLSLGADLPVEVASVPPDTGADAPTDTAGAATDTGADVPEVTAPATDWRTDGPFPVGHAELLLTDAARKRTLRVTLWYPAAESARAAADAGMGLADFYPAGSTERATLTGLLAKAPACVRTRTRSALDAAPAATGSWPVVAFSHCHTCVRFESTTVVERLASHGIAVIAPDHTGNTVFEGLTGTSAAISTDFLQTRTDDMKFVLDTVLDAKSASVPAALRGKFDATRVGALGHSFGGVTTGKLAMDDPRPKAAMALAVPMAQPLIPGVDLAKIHVPVAFVLAQEDHAITEFGNGLIRQNFADANPPAWLVEIADAGHHSVADIAGLAPDFMDGCGQGKRNGDQSAFAYLDNAVARAVTARVVGAFFGMTLLGQTTAAEALLAKEPAGVVTTGERK